MWLVISALLALQGAHSVALGLRVLVTERPLFMRGRATFVLMAAMMAVMLGNAVFSLLRTPLGLTLSSVVLVMPTLIISVSLIPLWQQMKSWSAYGIDADTFRLALHAALAREGLAFEEVLSCVKLPTLGAEIQVAVSDRMGTGNIRMKRGSDAALLQRIIAGIRDYYQARSVPVPKAQSVLQVALGLMILSMAVGTGWFLRDLTATMDRTTAPRAIHSPPTSRPR